MRFLMVKGEQVRGDDVDLTPDQEHYLVRVRRLVVGEVREAGKTASGAFVANARGALS